MCKKTAEVILTDAILEPPPLGTRVATPNLHFRIAGPCRQKHSIIHATKYSFYE